MRQGWLGSFAARTTIPAALILIVVTPWPLRERKVEAPPCPARARSPSGPPPTAWAASTTPPRRASPGAKSPSPQPTPTARRAVVPVRSNRSFRPPR